MLNVYKYIYVYIYSFQTKLFRVKKKKKKSTLQSRFNEPLSKEIRISIYIYEGARRVKKNGGTLLESEIVIILMAKEVIGPEKGASSFGVRNSSEKPCTGRVLKGECPEGVCACVCARGPARARKLQSP